MRPLSTPSSTSRRAGRASYFRVWLPASCLALTVGIAPALAEPATPPTRTERLKQAREQRRQHPLHVHRPGFLERTLLKIEKAERPSILDLDFKGLYPRVHTISSGSGLGAAVRFWQPEIGSSRVSVHASAAYSLARYELYDVQVGLIPHREGALPPRSTRGDEVYEVGALPHLSAQAILYASGRYRHSPRERFYGVGEGSLLENRTRFLLQDALYEVVGGYQFSPALVATARAGLLQVSAGDGAADADGEFAPISSYFSDRAAPGLFSQPDFLRLQATVLVDRRDRPMNPHRGGMLALTAARFSGRDGADYSFRRLAADGRVYVSLGSPQRVLAARFFTSVDEPDAGARVPFYLMDALSDSHTLRGFESFRFRAERLLALQAEYRWEAVPALELALFYDGGKAFRQGFHLSDLESGYGIGLRVKSHDAVLGRLDIARSREATRLYVRFGGAF